MSKIAETTENVKQEEEVTHLDEPSIVPQKAPSWPAPLPPLETCLGDDLLSSHLCLTAPDRDGFFLPIEGAELREDSHKLYRGLNPENTTEAMFATLAVGIFNSSLTAIADGIRQGTPLQVRDINLRLGLKGATVAADLLKAFNELRNGSQKRVSVGAVNVEAGGQAIVGNVQSGRHRRNKADGAAARTSRRHKTKPARNRKA